MPRWYRYIFDEEQIEDCQFKQDEIDELAISSGSNPNIFNPTNDVRWIGVAGEAAFGFMLVEKYDYAEGFDFVHHNKTDPFDDLDFTVGRMKIDVKTIATKHMPRPEWACDLSAKQFNHKMNKFNKVNCLVFSRYVFPDTCIVMGWISKKNFCEQAEFRKAGDIVNGNTIPRDMFEVPIYCLQPFSHVEELMVVH